MNCLLKFAVLWSDLNIIGKKLGNLSIKEEEKKELSVVTFTYKSHPLKLLESSQKDPQEKEMATRTPVFLPGKSLDREARWVTVHGVTHTQKRWTQLSK